MTFFGELQDLSPSGARSIYSGMNEKELRHEHQLLDEILAWRRRRQTIAILTTFLGAVLAMITGHGVFFSLFSLLGSAMVLLRPDHRDMPFLQHLRMVEHRLKDEWEKSKSSATLTVTRPPVEGSGPQARV